MAAADNDDIAINKPLHLLASNPMFHVKPARPILKTFTIAVSLFAYTELREYLAENFFSIYAADYFVNCIDRLAKVEHDHFRRRTSRQLLMCLTESRR